LAHRILLWRAVESRGAMVGTRLSSSARRGHRLVAAAVVVATLAAPAVSFVSGLIAPAPRSPCIERQASGPVPYDTLQKQHPKGYKKKLYKRMPNSRLSLEDIMKRITTVLLKNMEEHFRDAPIKTVDLMKEIGLTGRQMKTKRFIIDALQMLQAQKVIYKVKANPARWEIHEEYRKYGVPPVSKFNREPWALTHLLEFKRTKKPKFGPVHGLYRPKDRDFLKEKGLPLQSIYDPIAKTDPYFTGDLADMRCSQPFTSEYKLVAERVPVPPKDKDGKFVQFDADADE